jgi:hypothetical protein
MKLLGRTNTNNEQLPHDDDVDPEASMPEHEEPMPDRDTAEY